MPFSVPNDKPAERSKTLQSKENIYLARLITGRPIYINWISCTRSEASAVRKLWAGKLIRLVNLDATSHVATYEKNDTEERIHG